MLNIIQPSVFSGFIKDYSTGEPLAYTSIVLLNENEQVVSGAASDVEGYFILPDIIPAKYTIKIMLIGYEIYSETVTITQNNYRASYNLIPEPIKTREIKVCFYCAIRI